MSILELAWSFSDTWPCLWLSATTCWGFLDHPSDRNWRRVGISYMLRMECSNKQLGGSEILPPSSLCIAHEKTCACASQTMRGKHVHAYFTTRPHEPTWTARQSACFFSIVQFAFCLSGPFPFTWQKIVTCPGVESVWPRGDWRRSSAAPLTGAVLL